MAAAHFTVAFDNSALNRCIIVSVHVVGTHSVSVHTVLLLMMKPVYPFVLRLHPSACAGKQQQQSLLALQLTTQLTTCRLLRVPVMATQQSGTRQTPSLSLAASTAPSSACQMYMSSPSAPVTGPAPNAVETSPEPGPTMQRSCGVPTSCWSLEAVTQKLQAVS